MEEHPELSVFSANVWGLWGVSSKKDRRMRILAEHLRDNQYDIICLQELFQKKDFEMLCKHLPSEYSCVHQTGSGIVGSGLALFTRLPVREGSLKFVPFRSSGPMSRFWEGDWFAGKGAMLVQVILPDGQPLTIVNTHLQAGYGKRNYEMTKALQVLDMAKELDSKEHVNVLLMGDLNCEPGSLPWNLLMQRGNWREFNRQRTPTANAPGNSFANKKQQPQVLDHILGRGNLSSTALTVEDITKDGLSMSDHCSLRGRFKVMDVDEDTPPASLESTIELCERISQAIKRRRREKLLHLALSGTFLIITIVFAVTASVLAIADSAGAAGLTAAMAIIAPLGSALSLLFLVFAFDAKRAKAVLKDQLQEINFQSKA
jgi:endonuclease/exonuclease/phosphatase family metal-dependent hydrolase